MIDEKKIKEAANRYVGHKPEVDEGLDIAMERVSFQTGAQWALVEFLKSLWHDADEEPKKGRAFLAALQLDDGLGFWAVNSDDYPGTWKLMQFDGRIKRWCYIADILPEGEEEEIS